jgi:hypothetical protein
MYTWVDVNIGYQFATMFYREGGCLQVNTRLVSDVIMQTGGGGESLETRPLSFGGRVANMLIL